MASTQRKSARVVPVAPGTKILVVGLGKTGLSCARYLASHGITAAITDSRENPPGLAQVREELPDVALFLGSFQSAVFEAAEQLIVSPGVAVSHPLIQTAMANGVPVLGDIELFAREAKAPIVAITGSNGKSTVTTLVGEMAKAAGRHVAVGGNLGEPALDLLSDDVDLYVLELSSFQLETTQSLRAAVAVVLNISPDHMDRYAGLDAYAAAKAVVYAGAGVGVINRDDPMVVAMSGQAKQEVGFTLGVPAEGDFGLREAGGETWLCRGSEYLLSTSELLIAGRHNLANALAALALADAVGLPQSSCLDALKRFRGLRHRTQFVAEIGGVRWYNDSKGTNVGAVVAALEGMHSDTDASRTVLIAGGECKGADFSELAATAGRTARAVVLIGRDAPILEASLSGRVPTIHAKSMKDAVDKAAGVAQPGDRVLLSPACASFDMFKNFEDRGDAFVAAVQRLKA